MPVGKGVPIHCGTWKLKRTMVGVKKRRGKKLSTTSEESRGSRASYSADGADEVLQPSWQKREDDELEWKVLRKKTRAASDATKEDESSRTANGGEPGRTRTTTTRLGGDCSRRGGRLADEEEEKARAREC